MTRSHSLIWKWRICIFKCSTWYVCYNGATKTACNLYIDARNSPNMCGIIICSQMVLYIQIKPARRQVPTWTVKKETIQSYKVSLQNRLRSFVGGKFTGFQTKTRTFCPISLAFNYTNKKSVITQDVSVTLHAFCFIIH